MQVNDELAEFSHEKKGMSPLIATMLLIAFAVALGAMIMNWSSTLGENTGPDCDTVTMIINPYLCYAENMIKISVKNTGKPVEAISLKVSDANTENTILLKDSKLNTGDLLKKEIPFVKSSTTYVGLLASVKDKDRVVPCQDPAIELDDIPNC